MSILFWLGSLKGFLKKDTSFDDLIDDAHHSLTSGLLLSLSVLVSFKQFGGKPMECMVPLDWNGAWEQYAENFCWAENTYWLPFENLVPQSIEDRKSREIAYYQWVPFVLIFMGGCFKLPSFIWKMASTHSGIRVNKIISEAVDSKNVDATVRAETINSLTCHLANALKFHRRLERKDIQPFRYLKCLNLPYTAYYVTAMYLMTKVMYFVNIIVQFGLLNKFMETSKGNGSAVTYGFGLLGDLWNGTEWNVSGKFPRVTLCDVQVREMANLQRNTFQCVLTINLFNEKIFIFLWFWFMILSFLTFLSLCYWAVVLLIPAFHRWFITRHLELSEMIFDPVENAEAVHRFVKSYVKSDGMFVLRMLTAHTGIIFGTELTVALWKSFYGVEEVVRHVQGKPPLTAPPMMMPQPSFTPKRAPYLDDLTAVPKLFGLPRGMLRVATANAAMVGHGSPDPGSGTGSDYYTSCKQSPEISAIRHEKYLDGKYS